MKTRAAAFASLLAAAGGMTMSVTPQAMAQLYFTPGDLVVSVEGNGSNTAAGGSSATGNTGASAGTYLDNQASPLTLYEFRPTGTDQTPVGILTLPMTTQGSNSVISGEYGSSSEATIELSGNGRYLLIAGYGVNAASYNKQFDLNGTGTALAQSCSLSAGCGTTPQVPRVVAEIGASGAVNTSTVLFNVFNTNNARAVASPDGTTLFLSGQGVSGDNTEGVFATTLGSSAAHPLNTNFDARTVEIANNQLYVSVDSKVGMGQTAFVATVGSGLPTSGSQTETPLNGISSGSKKSPLPGSITLTAGNGNSVNGSSGNIFLSPENFFFANASTLYIADSGDPKAGGVGDGGLQKWSLVGGKWVLDYTLSAGLNLVDSTTATCASDAEAPCTTGLEGLTGKVVGDDVELFATNFTLGDLNSTFLYGITDILGDDLASEVSGEQFLELAQAPPDANFKGVAFAPVPEPSAIAGFGTALIGLYFARTRRRPRGIA